MIDHLFQADRENSDSSNPENQNMNTRHRKKWNVLETQSETSETESDIAKHTKEQAEYKDMWEKTDNSRNLKATPTEHLFTCRETECYGLSSLADRSDAPNPA